MPDQFAKETMPRAVLLARAGKAADNLADALRQAGAELVLTADPAQTDEAALRTYDPNVVLVALEPSIEQALEKFDALLIDPGLTVIYDEADLAVHRSGWEAARWVRHLSAKLRHDNNVLPPGTESDHDWQPSPGRIPAPAAAYVNADLAMFTREAVASADSVPSDGMPTEPAAALQDVMSLDAALLDAIPSIPAVQPPPLPGAPQPLATFEIESFEIESFETGSFGAESSGTESSGTESSGTGSIEVEYGDAVALDAMSLDNASSDADALLERIEIEGMSTATADSNVAPMNFDDDAFFLEELSAGDAVSTDAAVPSMQFDGGFDATLDFEGEADSDLDPIPAAAVESRGLEDVLSFEALMASSMATTGSMAESETVSAEERTPVKPDAAFSFGGLSLAEVDESPAVVEKPAGASQVHDLSALEARISGLSLVDLDEGTADTSTKFGIGGEVTGVVLVEAGLGGPDPARQLLSAIPAAFPAVVLVRLHLQGGRYDRLVAQMERAAALPVALAQNGAAANPGTIYFLPDGIGLATRRGGLEFKEDSVSAKAIFDALPTGDCAVVFLSGSDPQLVDTAMEAASRGSVVIAQSAEDCYDGAACAELRNRGAPAGLPAELAGRLASRWPS